jgi:hypothetical protein
LNHVAKSSWLPTRCSGEPPYSSSPPASIATVFSIDDTAQSRGSAFSLAPAYAWSDWTAGSNESRGGVDGAAVVACAQVDMTYEFVRVRTRYSQSVSQCPGCTESFEGLGIEREY